MTVSAVTLTPDTSCNPVSGAGAFAEPNLTTAARSILGPLLDDLDQVEAAVRADNLTAHGTAVSRGARPDYWQWLAHIQAAAACAHPIRLAGQLHTLDTRTGAIVPSGTTEDMPDGVLYKACGNRRQAVCPACAEVYRADTYQLILAGLRGGKGVPESVQLHPCAFPTFTAPSFGLVHSLRSKNGKPRMCRPRRAPKQCPHGVDLACNRTHHEGERTPTGDLVVGTPLCLDCYDYEHQVVWNCFAGELWRRTMETAKSLLAAHARALGVKVRPSFAKVAEMQARGVAHFHALERLDGVDELDPAAVITPPAELDYWALHAAITYAVRNTRFRTPSHPDNPDGWLIEWGRELLIKPVRISVDGEITEQQVAGYLAKYATKATEATGHVSRRITTDTIDLYANPNGTHTERLVDACWRLGRPGANLDPAQATKNGGRLSYLRLRRWAHMLGFGGHFSTKSRRYSTTLRALREARQLWRHEQHRAAEHVQDEETTVIVSTLAYAGIGWHTTGDAMLANTAAAKAREHARVAREEFDALH